MPTLSRVVLIGASGTLGLAVLKTLQSSAEIKQITVLTRQPTDEITTTTTTTTAPKQFPPSPKTTVIATSYEPSSLPALFTGHDAVIITAGLSSLPLHYSIIDACVQSKVSRLITDDFGNHPSYAGLAELEPFRATKGDILTAAAAAATSSGGTFSWTALATGHFLDVALHHFPQVFGFDLTGASARIVDAGTEPFSATTTPDIATAVLGILTHPDATADRWCMVRSAVLTQNAILHALQRLTGREYAVTSVDSAVLLGRGRDKIAASDRTAHLDLLPVQLYQAGAGRNIEPESRYDNELLGVRVRSVEDVICDVLEME